MTLQIQTMQLRTTRNLTLQLPLSHSILMTQSLNQPRMQANLMKKLIRSTRSLRALALIAMVRLTLKTCLHAKGQHAMRRCVTCTATFYYLLTYSSIIWLVEACLNSPKMTGSVTTSAVRMRPALHHVESVVQVPQLLESISGLTIRRDIHYMYLYLHAEARYGANRTISFTVMGNSFLLWK